MSEIPVFGIKKEGCTYVPRTASYAVVRNRDGLVAFVRGNTHIWLVGGGAEAHESAEATMIREALEEAGAELTIDSVIGAARQYFDAGGLHYDMHATFFTATFGDFVATPQETIVWLDPAIADAQVFHDSHRWAISRCAELQAIRT